MISSFIDRDFKFSLECVIDEPADLYLDCLIAEEINVSGERRSPKQGLDSLAKSKLQILAARTYKVYFDILDFDVEGTSLDDLTLSASVNYSDRANDKFYMGGQDVNGGGKYNNFVVDYRLGAILNHVGFVGNNIHSWRW